MSRDSFEGELAVLTSEMTRDAHRNVGGRYETSRDPDLKKSKMQIDVTCKSE